MLILLIAHAFAENDISVQYQYWDNGKPKQAKYFTAQGNLAAIKYFRDSGIIEQFIAYDNDANIIEESYYDIDGMLCKNPLDNWAAKTSKYTNGVLREINYYDENGQLTERDLYDASGNFTDKEFIGDERATAMENYKPDLRQFYSPEQEIFARTPVGVETNEYYDSNGNFKQQTLTVE